jgi:dTMP kinase
MAREYEGWFISFEGPDGSGKTTNVWLLAGPIQEATGREVTLLREPGGTEIGEEIRMTLHDPKNVEMHARTELLLYMASRAQLVEQVILPALERGAIVICDRFLDSSLAYQGAGRNLGYDDILMIGLFATGGLLPDLTVFFDISPEEGLRRRLRAADGWNRMEAQDLEFRREVYQGYQKIIGADTTGRFLVVPAEAEIHEVANEALERILERTPLELLS